MDKKLGRGRSHDGVRLGAHAPVVATHADVPGDLGARRKRVVRADRVPRVGASLQFEVYRVDAARAGVGAQFDDAFAGCDVMHDAPLVGARDQHRHRQRRGLRGRRWCGGGVGRRVSLAQRQVQNAGTSEDRQSHRLGRRPDERPVAGRDRDPDPMARRERLADIVELYAHPLARPWLHRSGEFMAVAVGEVEQAVAHARDAPVGPDVIEAHRDHPQRPVRGKIEFDDRRA